MEESKLNETKAFWDHIIRNEDGSLNEEQIYKELADFSFVMEQVPKVYCHITNNTLSKITYYADQVISVADDCYSEDIREHVVELADALIDLELISSIDRDEALKIIKMFL